jgi:hypothetical protein
MLLGKHFAENICFSVHCFCMDNLSDVFLVFTVV